MRTRLTVWYTAVLALVLLTFAITSYTYLARAARERTDASLSDTLDSLISTFNTELNDEGQPIDVSAQEAGNGPALSRSTVDRLRRKQQGVRRLK
jgi:hypothetical protein